VFAIVGTGGEGGIRTLGTGVSPYNGFIDRYVAFRDDESSAGSDGEEVEANAFGAALLMPARLVREEIKKHDLDLDDEDDLSALARKFNVSTSAISYRLVNLGLLR
jgi:Zn-dependent peptidase ImmA (M78 family)